MRQFNIVFFSLPHAGGAFTCIDASETKSTLLNGVPCDTQENQRRAKLAFGSNITLLILIFFAFLGPSEGSAIQHS